MSTLTYRYVLDPANDPLPLELFELNCSIYFFHARQIETKIETIIFDLRKLPC